MFVYYHPQTAFPRRPPRDQLSGPITSSIAPNAAAKSRSSSMVSINLITFWRIGSG
jgi:hypothetical protein